MYRFLPILGMCLLSLSGCGGGTSGTSEQKRAAGNVPPPEKVVAEFLEAVRTGNDQKVVSLLTPLARQKTTEMNLEVAPPGSDTAKFKVGDVEYIAEDGVHVGSEWIDLDENGQSHSDPIVWMLRREDQGWRIAGMATKVFDDEPPLFLNFEDPQDMVRKQQLVAQEMQRRAQQSSPAAGPSNEKRDAPVQAASKPRENVLQR